MCANLWRDLGNSVKAVLPGKFLGDLLPRALVERVRLGLQNFERHPPVLIYQKGKVGSTTIRRSLEQAGIPHPIYKVHFLSKEGLAREERVLRAHYPAKVLRSGNATQHLREGRLLRRRILRESACPWLIITGVREPVSRTVSMLFQSIYSRRPELLDAHGRVHVGKTLAHLHGELARFDEAVNYTCTWFDRELKKVFGVDVYETPFDHERGFVLIEEGRAKVLVLRQEDLSRSLPGGLHALLPDYSGIRVQRSNLAAKKKYAAAYDRVKERLTLPPALCERIYASRYVRHFYPEPMIERFIQRWTRGKTRLVPGWAGEARRITRRKRVREEERR